MIALAIVLGAIIGATLGALGAGGSILAVPVLIHVVGLSVATATATSLVSVGAAAVVSSVPQRANVRWGVAASFVAVGAPGALVGKLLGEHLEPDVLLLGFSVLMLVAAHRMLTACPSCTRVGEELALSTPEADGCRAADRLREVLVVGASGLTVGMLTGLFGVGGGFVIVPALTLAVGLAMRPAIATSLVIVAGNALVALFIRGFGAVDWSVAIAFTIPMLLGSLVGGSFGHRLDPQRSLNAFAVVLVAVAVANGLSAVL